MNFDIEYNSAKARGVDIHEHLDTIAEYCTGANTIIEMGVRSVVFTFAFLKATPRKLVSIDVEHPHEYRKFGFVVPDLSQLKEMARARGTDFEFVQASTLKITIPRCDILFIDTLHTYEQLKQELALHADKASKYVIMHDTTSFPELVTAIDEFLAGSSIWEIEKVYTNNNGLTILRRKNKTEEKPTTKVVEVESNDSTSIQEDAQPEVDAPQIDTDSKLQDASKKKTSKKKVK